MALVHSVAPSVTADAWPVSLPAAEQLHRSLAALGIDDLAKYRLACLFVEQPFLARDALACSEALGFHSPEGTERLLGDLAARGLLDVVGTRRDVDSYRLAVRRTIGLRLAWLLRLSQVPAYRTALLRALAARSLCRAARQRGSGRNQDLSAAADWPVGQLAPEGSERALAL
ncbi:MAG: hypothetical protein M1401_02740 [Chloroflexi bacterium]|nr:hypothetical protein [Chloroflexota bacterium]